MMELTPKSSWRREQESPRSSLMFAAQARHYEKRIQKAKTSPLASALASATALQQKLPPNTFAMLPRYCSEPSKRIVSVNPFLNSNGLAERLSAPTCSPDIFTNVQKVSECTEFHWTIEDISRIRPAKIESPLCQIDETLDVETESQVQEAIQLYFSRSHNIPSPLVDGGGVGVTLSGTSTPETPARPGSNGNTNIPPELLTRAVSTPCSKTTERRILHPVDVGTQTMLSLPPELPCEIEAILKPYMNAIDESVMTNDESNTSTNTLRRKLFFHSEDEPVSPVMCNYLEEEWRSKGVKGNIRQGWTPNRDIGMGDYAQPSTPEISPIRMSSATSTPAVSSREKRKILEGTEHEGRRPEEDKENLSGSYSRQRLDFTKDMDIDSSSQAVSFMNSSDLACGYEETEHAEDREYLVQDPEEIWQPPSGLDGKERCLVTPIFSSTIVGAPSGGVRLYESKNSELFQESKSDTGYQTMGCCTSSLSFSCCPSSMYEKTPVKGRRKHSCGAECPSKNCQPV